MGQAKATKATKAHYMQCDQIGRFLKSLATNVVTKEAQIFGDILAYFEKYHF